MTVYKRKSWRIVKTRINIIMLFKYGFALFDFHSDNTILPVDVKALCGIYGIWYFKFISQMHKLKAFASAVLCHHTFRYEYLLTLYAITYLYLYYVLLCHFRNGNHLKPYYIVIF
jgi:hypothetical protein